MKNFILLLSFLVLAGCTQVVDPDTGATETKFDAQAAQGHIATAQAVLNSTGAEATPWGAIASGMLALASAGLGVVAKVQATKKNKAIETVMETTKAANALLEDEDAKAKLLSAAKAIQEKLGTRAEVQKKLSPDDNIAKTTNIS